MSLLQTILVPLLGGGILVLILDRLLTWQSERRRRNELFRLAALLVSDELRANIVRLEIALEGTPEEIRDLQTSAYHEHRVLLAERLKEDVRDSLRAAYVFAEVPRSLHRAERPMVTFGSGAVYPDPNSLVLTPRPIPEQVEEALRRARLAFELLEPYRGKAAPI